MARQRICLNLIQTTETGLVFVPNAKNVNMLFSGKGTTENTLSRLLKKKPEVHSRLAGYRNPYFVKFVARKASSKDTILITISPLKFSG